VATSQFRVESSKDQYLFTRLKGRGQGEMNCSHKRGRQEIEGMPTLEGESDRASILSGTVVSRQSLLPPGVGALA
jgi:hypothetical protein